MKRTKQGKCVTCTKTFATCDATRIVWGIDRDPAARGEEADRVVECDAYKRSMTPLPSEARKERGG